MYLLLLFFLSLLSLVTADSPAPPKPVCTVPAIGIVGLIAPIHLRLHAPSLPHLHRHEVELMALKSFNQIQHLAVISSRKLDRWRNLIFTDSHLFMKDRKDVAFLHVEREAGIGYRQLAFSTSPSSGPLGMIGEYGCDENGRQQMEITAMGVNKGLFCVFCERELGHMIGI